MHGGGHHNSCGYLLRRRYETSIGQVVHKQPGDVVSRGKQVKTTNPSTSITLARAK